MIHHQKRHQRDIQLGRVIIRAVRKSASVVRRHFRSGQLRVSEKTVPGDLVSNVDFEVEGIVTAILAREFPHIPVIGEERSDGQTLEEAFYLDPVDGTLNFVHGLTPFAVSLGYWREGEPVAAAVCNPMTGELFSAVHGGGALCNGKAISPSRAALLRNALVAAGWPYDRSHRDRLYLEMDRVYMACQELRTIGCASLGMCYVACGIFDGYWEWGLKPWDMAAAVLIVTEAGGRVSSLTGGPFRLEDGSTAVSNGLIHEELVRAVGR